MLENVQTELLSRDALDFLPPYVAPASDAERKVAEAWAQQLKLDRVGRNDDYFELGGDSFGAEAIALALEKAFGVTFRSASFIEFPTVERQARHLAEATAAGPDPDAQAGSSLSGVQKSGRNPPLFYVHGGLGTTFLDRRFLEYFGPEQPIYFFRLPGIDGLEPPLTTVEALAARYVEQMRQVKPSGPYRIAANCSCGVIGLEMALQLQKAGETTERLILVDPVEAPTPRNRTSTKPLLHAWRKLKRAFTGQKNGAGAEWDETVADFINGQKKAMRFARRLREMDEASAEGVTYADVSDQAIARALTILLNACETYLPQANFEGRIDAIAGEVRDGAATSWQATCRNFTLQVVPGNHREVFEASLPHTVSAMRKALGC